MQLHVFSAEFFDFPGVGAGGFLDFQGGGEIVHLRGLLQPGFGRAGLGDRRAAQETDEFPLERGQMLSGQPGATAGRLAEW